MSNTIFDLTQNKFKTIIHSSFSKHNDPQVSYYIYQFDQYHLFQFSTGIIIQVERMHLHGLKLANLLMRKPFGNKETKIFFL